MFCSVPRSFAPPNGWNSSTSGIVPSTNRRISLYSEGGRCYIFRLLFDDAEIQMMTKEIRRFVVQKDFFNLSLGTSTMDNLI